MGYILGDIGSGLFYHLDQEGNDMDARQERFINLNGGRAKGPDCIIGGGGDGGGCTRWKTALCR